MCPDITEKSGGYFKDCKERKYASDEVEDQEIANKLWMISEVWTGLKSLGKRSGGREDGGGGGRDGGGEGGGDDEIESKKEKNNVDVDESSGSGEKEDVIRPAKLEQ